MSNIMFPSEILIAYLSAVFLIVLAPGPDNILAMSRGLSQGRIAAALSSIGAGLGIMLHTVAATLGLALVLQASPLAFFIVKLVGAAYLIWLGYKAVSSRNLISFARTDQQPLWKVFAVGLFSNILNPKPGLFVVAFIPQFVSIERGPVHIQMLVYGAIFSIVTAIIFTALGCFSAQLSNWFLCKPKVAAATNIGAGVTFMIAGLSILMLDRKSV